MSVHSNCIFMITKKSAKDVDDNLDGLDDSFNDVIDKPKKRVRRTKEELKENYVDPLQMEKLIEEYYVSGKLSSDLADMVQKIATRLGYAQNFINYSFKTEMIGDAVIKMITALTRKRFKCNSGYNPFSYFTKVAYRAFQNRIKKEKKEYETLHRYQEEVFNLLTENNQIPTRKNTRNSGGDDDSYDSNNEQDYTVDEE
jgi:hypothetical protein